MTYTDSSWAPDLSGFTGPRYVALANSIAQAIAEGRLPAGTRLPTQRQMARRLNLNIGTIAKAYAESARRGWVRGTVGRGTIALSVYAPKRPAVIAPHLDQVVENRAVFDALVTPTVVRGDRPSELGYFGLPPGPEAGWAQRACAAACASWAHNSEAQRKPLNALEDFHHALRYLSELTSARVSREHVLAYASPDAAIAAVLGTCAKPGDRIALPTLIAPIFLRIANSLNLDIVPLHSDEQGLLPESLELACWARTIRALVVQPDAGFGTGAAMPTRRRQQIAEIARKFDVTVIEDGAPGALRERAAPSLFSFNGQHVVYLASLSRALSRFLNPSLLVFGEGNALYGPLEASALIDQPNYVDSFLVGECFGAGLHRELGVWHKREAHQRKAVAGAIFGAALLGGSGYECAVKLPAGWTAELAVPRIRKTGLSIAEPSSYALEATGTGPLGRERPQIIVLGLGAAASIAALQRDLSSVADVLAGPARPTPTRARTGSVPRGTTP